MNLSCENARTLVPSYLDGELSEDQAGPLRRHLLACPACREIAKQDTNLKRWFVPGEPVPVPAAFSARVVRAAFLGSEATGVGSQDVAVAADSRGAEPRLRNFLLVLTAAAAALLIVVSAALRTHGMPAGQDMSAEPAQRPLSELLRELDRRNRQAVDDDAAAAAGIEGAREDVTAPGQR